MNANRTNTSGSGMNATAAPAMYGMGMNTIDPRIHYASYPTVGHVPHVMPGVTAAVPSYYNPAVQYHHAVGGYNMMPNVYGHVGGHAMVVPPPNNMIIGGSNATKSTEAMDQHMAMIMQQKQQLQMQMNGYPGMIGTNYYQNHQV